MKQETHFDFHQYRLHQFQRFSRNSELRDDPGRAAFHGPAPADPSFGKGSPLACSPREVIAIVRREFVHVDWHGAHGASHWARVRLHGLAIAGRTNASVRVVELFALLHDARRRNEWADRGHGERSAQLVREIGAKALGISCEEEDLLAYACRHHSHGLIDADISVQACWDADRLDLARVGIVPDPDRLCTGAARDLLRTHPAWFARNRRHVRWSALRERP